MLAQQYIEALLADEVQADFILLVLPEAIEPVSSEFRVSNSVLNVFMPQVMLNSSRIVSIIGELIAGAMPQHVGVNR